MKVGFFHTMLRLFCCALVLFPQYALAGMVNIPGFKGTVSPRLPAAVTPPPTSTVPQLLPNGTLQGATVDTSKVDSQSLLVINQNLGQQYAIIDWQSFNIGSDASVRFYQGTGTPGTKTWKPNSSYAALNRIWDLNPSLIFGSLKANGKIFLINQNGILFAPGSKINVNSLVASALNIQDDDFLNNVLHFKLENYQNPNEAPDPLAIVSNYGEIDPADGGYVFLIGPRVENYGSINAPLGQIGLVAATNVQLVPPGQTDTRSAYYVAVGDDFINAPMSTGADFGRAVNNGNLNADGGMVGMYGNNVDNWGVIRSVTAFQNSKGQVELRAANKVATGVNSSIDLHVDASIDPTTGQIRTVDDTFDIQPIVDIKGLYSVAPAGGLIEGTVNLVELEGSLVAPTGIVTVTAAKRVYLGPGSSIDVSGVKADLPMPLISDFQLNSVELRDDYAQKNGVLQGTKITTPATSGSTIGDLSQEYLTRERTALERSIGGAMTKQADGSYKIQSGAVSITASNADGDIIIKQGAVINISGGYINYAGGATNSTTLLSGMKIYDIGKAPLNLHYDGVLGDFVKTYDRYGIQETFTGLYYRGASPILSNAPGYTQGGDAGTLTLSAPTVVVDGELNAGVTRGTYQNDRTDASEGADALALSIAKGLEIPRAGNLTVNASSISVAPAPQADAITSGNVDTYPQQTGTTVLSAKILNAAGLGTLNLNANQAFTTASDTSLSLQPGGTFSAQAARIDHEGSITVSGGSITLNTTGAAAPGETAPQRIVLGSKSSLDASGERIDNTLSTDKNAYLNLGLLNGGNIAIMDETENGDGVFMASGSVVDVSGGYQIGQKGKVTGGSAGKVGIQGVNIMLEGDLRGYALADPNGKLTGGALTLTAGNADNGIFVVPAASIPSNYTWSNFDPMTTPVSSDMKGKLYLAADRFDDTGFTQIALNSMNNVTIASGAVISPSLVRLNTPVPAQTSSALPVQALGPVSEPVSGHPDLVQLYPSYAYMAGPSLFAASAGVTFVGGDSTSVGNLKPITSTNSEAKLTISPGAVIRTTANAASQISLTALYSVDMAGKLNSPGGQITLSSGYGDVNVEAGAKISAAGINLPDPGSTPKGFDMNQKPLSAGSVALSAGNGTLNLNAGSSIDISGSPEVTDRMQTADGNIVTFSAAGDPGGLSLSYGNNLNWNGEVKVNKAGANIKGGSLAISRTNSTSGLMVSSADIKKYQDLGFDDLTLKSWYSLVFSGGMNASFGRKLTLDAPVITGSGQNVNLNAPWIVLTNSSAYQPSDLTGPVSGNGNITFGGRQCQWIDVIGSAQITGFKNVTLDAARDIRLSETLYTNYVDNKLSGGKLAVSDNLALDADRVYPGNYYSGGVMYPDIYSDFTVYAPGTVTIRNSHPNVGGPIYSAGGTLTVTGLGGIDVEKGGYLAAPLGTITLSAPDQQIYLAAGSKLTTAANVDEVEYGGIDPNNIWVTEVKTNPDDLVFNADYFTNDSLPQKSINLNADTTVAMKGSVIDVHGGGSVFAYKFQPGVQGSVDPLTKPNRYVAIKASAFAQPGQTVNLQGAGLSGTYTLLPLDPKDPQNARYAFMPGAYIIEAQSGSVLPGAGSMSKDGYPLAIGYTGVANTSILGTRPQVYSVRTAAEVLATEGNYVMQSLTSGDGGNINITGNTIVLNGSFNGAAMTGPAYHGGKLSLSGLNITVQKEAASELPTGFHFGSPDADLGPLQNTVVVSTDGLSGKGFQEVDLGDVNGTSATNSITVATGADLKADIISLGAAGAGANSSITIANGAQLTAITGDGLITLATPGNLDIQGGSTVHASHGITLDVNNVQGLQGNLLVDNSALTLQSAEIFFGSSDSGALNGLYLTQTKWNTFASFEDITLLSGSDIQFNDAPMTLSAAKSLTLDAQRIVGNGYDVTVAAPTVNLKNSGATSTNTAPANTGAFTVAAGDQINIGGGDVLLGGFKTVNLNSTNDLALMGKGSLNTGNANLNISAARVVTSKDSSSAKKYIAPDFIINAGTGAVAMTGSGAKVATTTAPGGLLEIDARTIDLSTVLRSDGGTITLAASGPGQNDGVFLHSGSEVLARGTADAPGGQVFLQSNNGSIVMEGATGALPASSIDVSAGSQGDAGLISLQAPIGGVTLDGVILGAAQGSGKGGSFVLDTLTLDTNYINANSLTVSDMTQVLGALSAGGFTESADIRARSGNIDIASSETVQARQVKLTADDQTSGNGQIDVYGNIIGTDGGSVELYAMNDLNIQSGGAVKASASTAGSTGGSVAFSSEQGWVNVNTGGTVDVSGGAGGTIYLRAQQNANDVKINLNGSLKGAAAVYAEAVQQYKYNQSSLLTSTINFAALFNAVAAYYDNAANTVLAKIQAAAPGTKSYLLPGIEVINTGGDIKVDAPVDLSSLGADANPGTLTLRAAGNLNITQNLVDHPTSNLIQADPSAYNFAARNSWGLNLVAGADTNSADYLAVVNPAGNLTIANQTIVYTESAPINFASGGNAVIGSGAAPQYMINTTMTYNLASYTGAIHGDVGQDLVLNGGIIQTATGDIGIDVGRDLQLNTDANNYLGAVRTTGRLSSILAFGSDPLDPVAAAGATSQRPPNSSDVTTFYWRYIDGGDVALDVGRSVGKLSSGQWYTAMGSATSPQWDFFSTMKEVMPGQNMARASQYGLFSADYGSLSSPGARGLATMGGGNLSITTGGDFLAQAGTFGDGDLTINAGGDIRGRFLNHGPTPTDPTVTDPTAPPSLAEIHAMGNFGAVAQAGDDERVQVELFNSKTAISALGDMQIGAIVNPDLASGAIDTYRTNFVKCSYTPDTSITLKAGGDVTMAGRAPFYDQKNAASQYNGTLDEVVLPANVNIDAGGDISLLNNFTLASSPKGDLQLTAGGDIKGSYNNVSPVMMMSDIATDYWYGLFYLTDSTETKGQWISNRVSTNDTYGVIYENSHGYYKPSDASKQATAVPLHTGDTKPIVIQAGNDISDMIFYLPKQAEVTAGRDITDIVYEGQNLSPTDVSMIQAGRNISMQYVKGTTATTSTTIQPVHNGLIQGGPGVFLVEAGGSIDLGSLQDGIQAIGNGNNPLLGPGASSLFVLSGYTFSKTAAATATDIEAFFADIKRAGVDYANLLATGQLADADGVLQTARNEITQVLGEPDSAQALNEPNGVVVGDINMTSTQIASSNGKADIYVISSGAINLGLTSLPIAGTAAKATGITTGGGGDINVFARNDVNVQESRVMTFFSRQDMIDNGITDDDIASGKASIGDITIWSDQGDINAGRGSRTAVSASAPKRTLVNGMYVTVFTPPSVGSGIRAATYGDNAPTPGAVYLVAPTGIIDAGEAGIAGGQVTLAAVKIVNAANISFSAGSIGMPQQSAGAANIGSLSGSGSASQNSQLTSGVSGLDVARAETAQIVDDIIAKWLDVKVVDFVDDGNNDGNN